MDKCSNCNAEMRPLAKFCSRCGTARAQALAPDTPAATASVAHSHDVPAVIDVFKQAVMTPRATSWTNGKSVSTRILEHTADAAPALEEVKEPPPARPLDEDVPTTPVPEIPPHDEFAQVLDALESLFDFLDKNREEGNRQALVHARQQKPDGKKLRGMCLHICRQVIEVYKNRQTERYLANDDFKPAFVLVQYALQKSEEELQSAADSSTRKKAEEYLAYAKKYACVLEVLYTLRSGQLTPADLLRQARNSYREKNGGLAATLLPWKDIASIVSASLYEQGQAQKLIPDISEVARQWVEAWGDIEAVDEEAYTTVVSAAQAYAPELINPLAFLPRGEQANFLHALRAAHLGQIGDFLRDKQRTLLQLLGETLADADFGQPLEPRRSVHLVVRTVEFIPWIKELLARQDERAPEQALLWFKWLYEDKYIPAESAPILREWYLYVKARARGLLEVFGEWQEDRNQGVATWEEIWNMAAAQYEHYTVSALKILLPGVKVGQAPFSHLTFALSCAVSILLRKEAHMKESMELAEAFLLEALWKLPVPLASLTWLALANDVPELVDSEQHFSRLKVFQKLLDRAIVYSSTAHNAHTISIEDFAKELQELLLLAQKLEDAYVVESPQKSIMLTNTRLGISFRIVPTTARTARSPRKRVGIFVDYENLLFSLPEDMQRDSELIARTLLEHASTYGGVVSRWICYSPANLLRTLPSTRLKALQEDFQNAGFRIEVPRDVDGNTKIIANQSDSVLIECITSAMMESHLDVYIIVSGDHFYYERVRRLLEKGHTVSVVSYISSEEDGEKKLSDKYTELEKNSRFLPEKYGRFTIDNILDIFQLTPQQIAALDAAIKRRHDEKNNKG